MALFSALVAASAPALAEKRVALVIGNGAYKHAPALANPKNDAEGMTAALKRMKFEVVSGVDLDKPALERLLRDFAQRIEGADVALVFYAGHGLQVHGRNYFVPVDSKLERESDLDFEAVPLELLQRLMEQGQRTNIIVLDACRDNPLARNLARSMGTRSVGIGRGLGQAQAGVGTLIVYATQPGNVALDGQAKNSPFTEALLKHIEAPGLEVRLVVSRVRQAVIAATKGKQVPWDSSSLVGEVYLAAMPAAPESTPPAATDAPRGPAPEQETVFWQSIQNSKSAADFKAYLERYPNGTFAALAKIRLAEIEKAAAVTPPPPPEKRVPEKTEQPAKPAAPQRTSSWVPGAHHDFDNQPLDLSLRVKTATTGQCQARCLAIPTCVGWSHQAKPGGTTTGICDLFGRINGKFVSNPLFISGVIRATPAAAPAQPASPKPAARMDSPIAEIRRKALAREKENGFCASVPWQSLGASSLTAFIDQPRGATFTNAVQSGCSVFQIVAIGVARGDASLRIQPGSRCIKMVEWICDTTADCRQRNVTFCKTDHPSFSPGCKCE